MTLKRLFENFRKKALIMREKAVKNIGCDDKPSHSIFSASQELIRGAEYCLEFKEVNQDVNRGRGGVRLKVLRRENEDFAMHSFIRYRSRILFIEL